MSSESKESSLDEIPSAKVASEMSNKNKNMQIKRSKEYIEVMQKISDSINIGKCEASSLDGEMSDDLVDFLYSLDYVIISNDKFGWRISWEM